jgi:ABC-2 type transport system ATP-binding protein
VSSLLGIQCEGLQKRFGGPGEWVGLLGLDLGVPDGSVCGLLGPNGAGKTTAIRVLTTLTRPDAGRALVAGFDVVADGERVRQHVSLVGQDAAIDERLTGRQNLVLFGRLHGLRSGRAKRRADELLDRLHLVDAADRTVSAYSGGMRRRLDLAASLVVTPSVLFVDEPTAGLDPAARRDVWTGIRELAAMGTTVLLTTQYLEEADELADHIAMLRSGVVVAEGTPDDLKARVGGDRVEVVLADDTSVARAREAIGDQRELTFVGARLSVPVPNRITGLIDIATNLRSSGIESADLALRRPTLDGVFLHLTGDPASDTTDQAREVTP